METIFINQQKNYGHNFINFWSDARHFQIAYLGSFLLMGILFLQWQSDLAKYITIIASTLATQALFASFTNKNLDSLKSALITSLGLCLMCKTNMYQTAALAGVIAIASKFLIKWKGKHIFNPVNFGIIGIILLSQDAWISPGQWGSHVVLLFVLGALGFLVLKKVNRIDTSITFLIVFGGLQFIRSILYLGWSLDVYAHQMTSGTLMLFTFFMITDPMTTPNHRTARIIWTALISIAAFILANFFFVNGAPIWVLFFASPLVPFFDKWMSARKFEWNESISILKQ